MSCITPIMFLGGINLLFSLFDGSAFAFALIPVNPIAGFAICGSVYGELIGSVFAYRCYKYMQGDGGGGGGGMLPGMALNTNARQLEERDPRPANAGTAPGFQAFQGE